MEDIARNRMRKAICSIKIVKLGRHGGDNRDLDSIKELRNRGQPVKEHQKTYDMTIMTELTKQGLSITAQDKNVKCVTEI